MACAAVPPEVPPQQGSTIRSTSPYIMLRYAEILLNYAEAQHMLGNDGEARTYANLVRQRPGVNMPDITESGDLRTPTTADTKIQIGAGTGRTAKARGNQNKAQMLLPIVKLVGKIQEDRPLKGGKRDENGP